MGWMKHEVWLLKSRRSAACDDDGVEIFTDHTYAKFRCNVFLNLDSVHEG